MNPINIHRPPLFKSRKDIHDMVFYEYARVDRRFPSGSGIRDQLQFELLS